MAYKAGFLLSLILILHINGLSAQFLEHHNGHSHNDYEQRTPLFDALKHGFTSIEVDIQSFEDNLVVAHDPEELNTKPSLRDLYLSPLDSIIQAHEGTIFKDDSTTLILMIDLKEEKKRTLKKLASVLDDYKMHLYKRQDSLHTWGAIKVLLSGDPPLSTLQELNRSYFFIDGRVDIIYPSALATMVDRISASYALVWNTADRDQSIRDLAKWSHDYNRKLRFWATPDKPQLWQKLNNLKVDWVSVDNLKKYRDFYYSELSKKK